MPHLRHLPGRALLALLGLAVFLPVYLLSLAPGRGDSDSASPERHEHVPRRKYLPSLTFLAPPALAVFLAVYLLGLVPASDSSSAGPVRIEEVRINRLPQASSPRIEVEVDLKNHDQIAHDIQAWWLLARPGANRPWSLYAFHSSIQGPRTLAAGEKVKLGWQEEISAEPGTYELSVWVHIVDDDTTRHSDGKRLGAPTVRIDSQWAPFSRRATPPPGLRVSAIDLPAPALDGSLSVPTELPVTIVITNDTAVETVADVQWFLYRRTSRLPWSGKPAYTSREFRHQVFAPNGQTTITTSEPISLWPGEYLVRVVVTETNAEGSTASDDLFLNDPITVLENNDEAAIIRVGPASGPVEIANLTADTGAFQRGKGFVTVNLRNRSESEQEVVLWWFLSRPGTLQPWVEFDLQSKVFTTTIARESQAILDLSDDASLPPGTYELSVWIHTLNDDGDERPSDGAWLNRRVEIR